jgi:hypothetical protein
MIRFVCLLLLDFRSDVVFATLDATVLFGFTIPVRF